MKRAMLGVLCALWFAGAWAAGMGTVGRHAYHWQEKDGVATALYDPYLPRTDSLLTAALTDFIKEVYGPGLVADARPGIVNRGGTNMLRIRGTGWDYLFLIIKDEATGKVASASMWRERRTD